MPSCNFSSIRPQEASESLTPEPQSCDGASGEFLLFCVIARISTYIYTLQSIYLPVIQFIYD